jgi:hypothetical protein
MWQYCQKLGRDAGVEALAGDEAPHPFVLTVSTVAIR